MYPSDQPAWRKSSQSGTGENCVEVARVHMGIAVRDSKSPDGSKLTFSIAEWRRFVDGIKNTETSSFWA